MRDVVPDEGQQLAERIIDDVLVKGAMPNPRADAQGLAVAMESVEPLDFVDVDQMRRLCQPERHDRHQALPAGENPAILGRHFGEHFQRLIERFRHVADEGRGFHAAVSVRLYVCKRYATAPNCQTGAWA